jgi:hypothetical protein
VPRGQRWIYAQREWMHAHREVDSCPHDKVVLNKVVPIRSPAQPIAILVYRLLN